MAPRQSSFVLKVPKVASSSINSHPSNNTPSETINLAKEIKVTHSCGYYEIDPCLAKRFISTRCTPLGLNHISTHCTPLGPNHISTHCTSLGLNHISTHCTPLGPNHISTHCKPLGLNHKSLAYFWGVSRPVRQQTSFRFIKQAVQTSVQTMRGQSRSWA